ncbi:hypothetical protein AB0I53_01690 [Saccharopolyspora sp. NPDC050389]
MAVEVWRWTGRRVLGAVVPLVMFVGSFALMRFTADDGPRTWGG